MHNSIEFPLFINLKFKFKFTLKNDIITILTASQKKNPKEVRIQFQLFEFSLFKHSHDHSDINSTTNIEFQGKNCKFLKKLNVLLISLISRIVIVSQKIPSKSITKKILQSIILFFNTSKGNHEKTLKDSGFET